MRTGGADALTAAARRALPIVVGFILIGIVAVNAFERLKGPQYQASATVEISATPLADILTGTVSPVISPQEVQDTALALAGNSAIFQLAAQSTHNRFGGAGQLNDATSVSEVADTDLLTFSASAAQPDAAIGIVNAVAQAYVSYRTTLISNQLAATIAQLRATLATLPASNPEDAPIESEIVKLQVDRGASATNAAVVESATAASDTSPSTAKSSLIGLSIGLVLALILVGLREAIDTRVRSDAEVEDILSVPVLATIRSLPKNARLVTVGPQAALYGDAYAVLAARVAGQDARARGTLLAVTSAVASEGKTTTASNLGVALARRGNRVLLVDFDFRRPMLGRTFGIPADASGAVYVLDGIASIESALWQVDISGKAPVATPFMQPIPVAEPREIPSVYQAVGGVTEWDTAVTPIPPGGPQSTVFVLPAGTTAAPERMTSKSRSSDLLDRLRTYADVVILDTPPTLLTAEMTELSKLVDAVVVVVRQGFVTQRALRTLTRQTRTWNADLIGAVVTDVQSSDHYGSYSGRH